MKNCCENCFSDRAIREIIIGNGTTTGTCDFCHAIHVHTYDLDGRDKSIQDMLADMFALYKPDSGAFKSICGALLEDWEIFNASTYSETTLSKLMLAMFPSEKLLQPGQPKVKLSYKYGSSLLLQHTWAEFTEYLKHSNRFHVPYLDMEAFNKFFNSSTQLYATNDHSRFWRARIAPNSKGYKKREMGAPPKNLATPGRINPTGISELYLSKDDETAIHEIRSGMFDWVTIGKFKLVTDIQIVNLSAFSAGSPFEDDAVDFDKYLSNRHILQAISLESARQMRRADNPIDYLPTQYVAELAKAAGFDGVQYDSTLNHAGVNICLFDPSKARCISTKTVRIRSVQYEREP